MAVGVPLRVQVLFAHAPDTPDGKPVTEAPEALAVVYFICEMAEPAVTVWAVLPETRVMAGRGCRVTDPALVRLAVQPAELRAYRV